MSEPVKPPAPNPCGSCPYRRDVPSGLWEGEEYEKLIDYDGDTAEQPIGVFLCHRQDGRACAGWVAVHDMDNSLALRLGCASGHIEDPEPFLDYETSTPVWNSGAEAAEHGLRDVRNPSPDARRAIDKLKAAEARRAG